MTFSFQDFKKQGYEVFSPMAPECVKLLGDGLETSDNTHYLVVISKPGSNETAIILSTGRTAETIAARIQNIETKLDSVHKFVDIKREHAEKRTVDSFLQDAKSALSTESAGAIADNGESPAFSKFRDIIREAVERNASDIHYYVTSVDAKYVFRIDGVLSYEQGMNVTEAREMMSSALNTATKGMSGYEDDQRPFDLPIELKVEAQKPGSDKKQHEHVTLRLARRGKKGYVGYKAVMRVNVENLQQSDLASLAYPKKQEALLSEILDAPYGIFLATGPVGSGKSTTSAALMERFSPELGGLTIEDPIEFKINHPNIFQYQVDESNEHMSLTGLLKSSLRQDPDLISVAEIRDSDVATQVFAQSKAGTVMMSTVHTNEAIYTYSRLLDLGIRKNELAATDTFLGILNQRLMRKMCPDCKIGLDITDVGTVFKHNPDGCDNCKSGRISGRIAVSELLIPGQKDGPFILAENWEGWRNDLLSRGFKTLALRALELSKGGIVSWTDAVSSIPHIKRVDEHVRLYHED